MKLNRDNYILLIQFLILLLFLGLTLLNEQFDLPSHLLHDPPVSLQHRHGEMFIELTFFCLVVLTYFMIYSNLLKKLKHYERQKEILERTFYHDIHNTAVVLHGFARLLQKADRDKTDKYRKLLYQASQQLLDEIEIQKDISAAEKNELLIHPRKINSIEILSDIIEQYQDHGLAKNRHLVCADNAHNIDLVSDKTLIRRVLGNMVKNALEASGEGQTITLGCVAGNNHVEFHVHNPHYIPREVQESIFRYSFTTKGKGRGIGTYSMKLLCERILKGRIYFHSSEEAGTTFTARLPLHY